MVADQTNGGTPPDGDEETRVQLHSAVAFDNSATPARFITVKPLAAAMGAEISGVDLRSIEKGQTAEIRSALSLYRTIILGEAPL
jgi:hypothetical protein